MKKHQAKDPWQGILVSFSQRPLGICPFQGAWAGTFTLQDPCGVQLTRRHWKLENLEKEARRKLIVQKVGGSFSLFYCASFFSSLKETLNLVLVTQRAIEATIPCSSYPSLCPGMQGPCWWWWSPARWHGRSLQEDLQFGEFSSGRVGGRTRVCSRSVLQQTSLCRAKSGQKNWASAGMGWNTRNCQCSLERPFLSQKSTR